ncbi:MAG: NADH:flavin oxidoreductase, partial [Microcystaceae cyanobacterium]
SHSGRQRDIAGVENKDVAVSSTKTADFFHGILCRSMSKDEIKTIVKAFGRGAWRAKQAGLDGVELHGANGYLITQFLSSGINDRTDEYGGSLKNRARFLLEICDAVRQEVGDNFHFQVKISAEDFNDALFPWEKSGNKLEDTLQVCQWITEEGGVDAIHVSVGSLFPHPLNPPGTFPLDGKYATDKASNSYDTMLSSGTDTVRNEFLFRYRAFQGIFEWLWYRIPNQVYKNPNLIKGDAIKSEDLDPGFRRFVSAADVEEKLARFQGRNIGYSREVKKNVKVPVICTGGFQQASFIRKAINEGYCDAVSMARMLVANNDLANQFAEGRDVAKAPCTYCNKCLLNVLENPLGCYEPARYGDDYDEMIRCIMTVYD